MNVAIEMRLCSVTNGNSHWLTSRHYVISFYHASFDKKYFSLFGSGSRELRFKQAALFIVVTDSERFKTTISTSGNFKTLLSICSWRLLLLVSSNNATCTATCSESTANAERISPCFFHFFFFYWSLTWLSYYWQNSVWLARVILYKNRAILESDSHSTSGHPLYSLRLCMYPNYYRNIPFSTNEVYLC